MEVGLVVHEPEGDLGNPHWPFFNLNSVKLVDIDLREAVDLVECEGLLTAVLSFKNLKLKRSQFSVRDDQEVAAAAGGIKKLQLGQLYTKLFQAVSATSRAVLVDGIEFASQGIEKERMNDFENIALRGIVSTDLAALSRLHYLLEERTENGRGYARPVEVSSFEQGLAHWAIERGELQTL
jgi:hypothetical protein